MPKTDKLWIDCIAGSQLRDSQGEMLSVEGADIADLEAGKGRWNDNHGKGFFNSIGRITEAKKIFKAEDCENERHEYYWNKIQSPYIYAKGYLYSDEDHQNAKAASAILRNIHKDDSPLKLKASVEGGVIQRGIKDSSLLKRTKVHSVALTFTPANQATLVEPLDLNKSLTEEEHQADLQLIKSVMHLAETNVPSFRHITRNASAHKIQSNVQQMQKILNELGIKKSLPEVDPQEIIEKAIEKKIDKNVNKINELVKELSKKKDETLEKASKKQMRQILGDDDKHKEIIEWTSENIKDDVLSSWFLKEYKKDQEVFSVRNRSKLLHALPVLEESKDFKLDKKADFNANLQSMTDHADNIYAQKMESGGFVEDPEATKLLDVGNGYAWYSLNRSECDDEGAAMGHCGNTADSYPDDNILSLRKEYTVGNKKVHRPSLTFIENNGYLGEMKGRQNNKPNEKYHEAIKKLLLSDHIEGVVGGGYAPDKNFALEDMSPDMQKEILNTKPEINAVFNSREPINNIPDKFEEDMQEHNRALKALNAFEKDGTIPKEDYDIDVVLAHKDSGKIADIIRERIKDSSSPDESSSHVARLLRSRHAIKEDVNIALNDKDKWVRRSAVQSKHFAPEHMEQALKDESNDVRQAAVQSKHFAPEHMEQALKDESNDVRRSAVQSKHFTPEHMEQALKDESSDVRESAVQSKHFAPEHMEQALKDESNDVRFEAIRSKHFAPEHMEQALNDKDKHVRESAVQSKHFAPEHMEQALNDKDTWVRQAAVRSKHFTPEHMEQALKDESNDVRQAAVQSKHFAPEHMEQALNNKDTYVRQVAIRSKHFTPEHMEQALNDKDKHVRRSAVQSKHFTPEHMEQALNDKDMYVRYEAIRSKHFAPEHMEQALNDKDKWVRRSAVQSKHFTPEHMEQALKDESSDVRESAVQSKHFAPEHMEQALKDESNDVRFEAIRSKHFAPEHFEIASNTDAHKMAYTQHKGYKEWHDKQSKIPKIEQNIDKINKIVKSLCAGYGGAGVPTDLTGSGVFQGESLEGTKKKKKKKKKLKKSDDFKYVTCNDCGKEQIYAKYQVKCRNCKKSLSFAKIFELIND